MHVEEQTNHAWVYTRKNLSLNIYLDFFLVEESTTNWIITTD
jgi:hypothetical protein